MTTKETCSNCGSVYEVTTQKVIFRDQDSFDCDVCGQRMDSWSSSRIPRYRLIERHEKHKA